MLEAAVIGLRWLQYSGAVILFGAPLFLLYSFRGGDGLKPGWARLTLILAALVVALGSLAALVAQTAVMAGALSEAIKPASLSFMVSGTALGMAMAVRAVAALVGLVGLAVLKPGRTLWGVTAAAGLIVVASFAWTGHGAATGGAGGLVHLAADVVHAVAAALWLGALAALTMLLRRAAPADVGIHRALHGFAGVGTFAVALLVLTGLVNSWFLVGPTQLPEIGGGPYGLLLMSKLVLFVLMLALAAGNRFRLTPRLGAVLADRENPQPALRRLRLSVVAETLVGAVLLAVVAVMGTLPPPSAL